MSGRGDRPEAVAEPGVREPIQSLRIAVSAAFWDNPSGERLGPWLADVRAMGFEGVTRFVDFWVWGDDLGDGRTVRMALAAEGLGLASVVTGIHADLDRYRRLADILSRLDCHHLVLIGGESGEDRAALADRLDRIGAVARDHDVSASYHHHTDTAGETFRDVQALLALADPSLVNLTYDSGHATKDFIELPLESRAARSLRELWDRVALIELKDWLPESGLDTPVGDGFAHAGALLDELVAGGYADWIVVEQNDDLGRTLGDKHRCAVRSLEFIRARLARGGQRPATDGPLP